MEFMVIAEDAEGNIIDWTTARSEGEAKGWARRFEDKWKPRFGPSMKVTIKQILPPIEEKVAPPKSLATFAQAQAPSHDCPVCGDAVAGGPDEYLGHIRTEHPEEWRRLETDPGYTLRPKAMGGRITVEEERVMTWILDLIEAGEATVKEISDHLDVPPEVVRKVADTLIREGKIEWDALTGKYIIPGHPSRRAEAGILRCKFCGAPYTYRENLEIHEKGCTRRI